MVCPSNPAPNLCLHHPKPPTSFLTSPLTWFYKKLTKITLIRNVPISHPLIHSQQNHGFTSSWLHLNFNIYNQRNTAKISFILLVCCLLWCLEDILTATIVICIIILSKLLLSVVLFLSLLNT